MITQNTSGLTDLIAHKTLCNITESIPKILILSFSINYFFKLNITEFSENFEWAQWYKRF